MPVFENCSCIAVGFAQSNTTTAYLQNESTLLYHGTATDGVCDRNCNQLGLFAAGIGVLLYLIFMLKIPTTLVTLRYSCLYVYSELDPVTLCGSLPLHVYKLHYGTQLHVVPTYLFIHVCIINVPITN